MIAQMRHPIVTATSNLSQSFGYAFGVTIPPVGYVTQDSRIKYNWKLLEDAKLVIFTGGADINPAIYGQRNKYSQFSPERDTAEIEVLRQCLARDKKMLGVCRGHQLINGYLGGLLVQDITMELNVVHENDHSLEVVDEGGLVPNVFCSPVNSLHHQGVVKAGEGLTPTTYWQGVYESTESDFALTVQFHPEWMHKPDNALNLSFWDVVVSWASLDLALGEAQPYV
jgi:putative glutamine amidotransferase